MRALLSVVAVVAAILAFPVAAQRASIAPWVTGEILLKKLEPVSPKDVPWSPQSGVTREELAAIHTHTNVEYVRGFIDALHDATEGKAWCYSDKYQVPKPAAFWDESRWGLGRLPATERKRSASELLPEIWRAKWPCPSEQRRKP